MTYLKIILALLVWAGLFFYGGTIWLDKKREQTCMSEIEKTEPNIAIVNERCTQTAKVYMKNKDYGSAAWFYLLAGDYEKNIDEVEAQISDDFYMNIGHSYILKGDYKKAKEIYLKYPWEGGIDFHYADKGMQSDFVTLPKLYKDKRENLEKGLALWNEIYKPIGKIVEASNAYEMAKDAEDSNEEIKYLTEYLKYAKPFKDKEPIAYIAKKKDLAELYAYDSKEKEAISLYKELVQVYETNESEKFNYLDTLLTIAKEYSYMPDYNASLDYYEQVVTLSLDSNESNNSDDLPLNIDMLYSNMADIYKKMHQYNRALAYHGKSLNYLKEYDAKNYNSLSAVYSNIGEIYYMKKDYNTSIEKYHKAIEFTKEELKDSEDYYRDYIFSTLQELYVKLADNYMALNMSKKAYAIKKEYVSFLEYEYETHYKLIANAYNALASNETNASVNMDTELKAIKFIKKSVETEQDEIRDSNNIELYKYMENLKEYISDVNESSTKGAKAYLEYIESFKKFEEEVYGGEDSSNVELAMSNDFVSTAYDNASDINKSITYAHKAVEFIEKVIENKDENRPYDMGENGSYSYRFDKYTYHLLELYNKLNLDANESIDRYLNFKKSHYKEGSEELVAAYETVGKFFLNHKSIEDSIKYYKKALNEAVIKMSENDNSYLVEQEIDMLQNIYADRKNIDRNRAIVLMDELIVWQNKNYDDKFILGQSNISLADIYAENNETLITMEKYDKSIKLFKEYIDENNNSINSIYELKDIYKKVSIYYIEHGEKKKALNSMQTFIVYVEKTFPDNKEELSMCYGLFSNIYKLMNDTKNSKIYKDKAQKIIEKKDLEPENN